ncbi:MAG TPA: PP2C family serine/threonine-protein phosphatase [Acidobacteriota bacterium]|nr:PP2C family serine/threonine-protein phosphatase [Acidobacteriota bacterium]
MSSNNNENESLANLCSNQQTANPVPEPLTESQPPSDLSLQPTQQVDQNSSPASKLWRYQPVPEGLDRHDESHQFDETKGIFQILGARVRGRKHKHEGTNCDDWFEVRSSGPWTLFAISDGAGSYPFSRVGAKVACQAAIKSMDETLKDHQIIERSEWTNETVSRDDATLVFREPDIEKMQEALHKAFDDAYVSVIEKARDLAGQTAYYKFLNNRDLKTSDLSATLLLAAHVPVRHQGQDFSLVMACQVGDGMTAAIDLDRNLNLLGVADSGQFSGETQFLTDRKWPKSYLARKTYAFFRQLDTLFVMTDGVADDYFPNDPEILRMRADLILNGVIGMAGVSEEAISDALKATNLPTLEDIRKAEFHSIVETIEPTGSRPIKIRSTELYADKLGLNMGDVLSSCALLIAGAKNMEADPDWADLDRATRLCLWLDTYHIRGSFDDRTLVIMHRGNAQ